MRKKAVKIAGAVGLLASTAIAATPVFALELEEEFIITGKHEAWVERFDTINAKIVITREEIARFGDLSAGDVLKRLPGVTMGGAPGENKDVRLRGLDKEFTQVLINGKRIPGAGAKREFQVDRIPASLIERIELIRSPRPDIDAQGVAGTINIVLREIPDSPFVEVEFGGSLLGGGKVRPRAAVIVGGKVGDLGYVLAADVQDRENTKNKIKENFKSDGTLKDSEVEEETKVLTDTSFAPRFTYAPAAKMNIEVAPLWLRSEEDKVKTKNKFDGGGKLKEREDETEEKIRKNQGVDVSLNAELETYGELGLDFGFRRNTEAKDKVKEKFKGDKLDKEELEREDKRDREISVAGHWRQLRLGKHSLGFSVEALIKDRVKQKTKIENGKDKTKPKDSFRIAEDKFSFSAADVWTITPRWVVAPGVRVEYLERDAADAAGFTQSGSELYANPSLQSTYRVVDWAMLRFSAARTVRQPKFDELVPVTEEKDGSFEKPDKTGNPDLMAEKALSLDGGVDLTFLGKSGFIGLNTFFRRLNNKIEKDIQLDATTGRFFEIPVNIGTGKVYGLEIDSDISGKVIGLDGLSIHGNATFIDSQVKVAATGETRSFKDQPDFIYNVGFDQEFKTIGLAFGGNYNHVSNRLKIDSPEGARKESIEEVPDTADIYIRQRLWSGAELRFSAKNLRGPKKRKTTRSFKPDGSLDKIEKTFEKSRPTYNLILSMRW